ncbi:MAG TPA: DUF397 domain-containing protein [Streptosporangiaceae bacterium]|nr:DUF397 domain-containing protein [Streptosporangiaceae bacterium]
MAEIEESHLAWRTSQASNSGACIEVATRDRAVLVRDSMDRGGPVLQLPAAAWAAFLMHAQTRSAAPRRM